MLALRTESRVEEDEGRRERRSEGRWGREEGSKLTLRPTGTPGARLMSIGFGPRRGVLRKDSRAFSVMFRRADEKFISDQRAPSFDLRHHAPLLLPSPPFDLPLSSH